MNAHHAISSGVTDDLKLLTPSDYPRLLQEIPDRPKRLHLRGSLPSPDKRWLAVVGSRACTNYGRQVCKHLINGLRGYPIVIVSGLAYGTDAEAHRNAIDAGLTTVGVPGSGLDWNVLYPKANVGLAREILANGGALLSEEEPGARTMNYMFPRRNRVMAGLSHATLIIEAREKSGTLITAKLTTEYNRELLVVPGNIFSEESRGSHQFLKLGATPITSPADILVALGIKEHSGAASLNQLREDLSSDEQRIYEILATPLSRDELIDSLDMDISDANVLLSTMEIKGLIIEELGVVRIA